MKVCSLHNNWFSEADCDYITKYADAVVSLGSAKVGKTNGEVIQETRKGKTGFLFKNEPTQHELWNFLYSKLTDVIYHANKNVYGFDLAGLDGLQYTVYEEGGDHYNWHTDVFFDNSPFQRKLSVTLQLTNSNEYQGGDFQFLSSHEHTPEQFRTKGTAIVFPSFMSHRVTPVTSGTRKSIVAWFEGRRFH